MLLIGRPIYDDHEIAKSANTDFTLEWWKRSEKKMLADFPIQKQKQNYSFFSIIHDKLGDFHLKFWSDTKATFVTHGRFVS